MRRRHALLALACSASQRALAHTPVRVCVCGAVSGSAASDTVVAAAWSDVGVWLVHEGRSVAQPLPTTIDARLPPLAVPGGLWSLADARELRHWRYDADGRWQQAASRSFDEDVHALAASADGSVVFVAHGERLSLLDGSAALRREFDGSDLAGRRRGRAASIVAHAGRRSVVVSWPALGEWWEISLDRAAAPIFDGLVHDYRMGEAIAKPGYLGARRVPLGMPMPEPEFVDGRVPWVAGHVGDEVQVVNLDVRRRIGAWALSGALPAVAALQRSGSGWIWWLPAGDALHAVEPSRWRTLDRLALPGDASGALPVRRLQVLGDTLWLLAADASHGGLWLRRAEAWQHVALGPGRPVAMQTAPALGRALVAMADPPRLLVLAEDAALQHDWTLPAPGALRGAHWLSG